MSDDVTITVRVNDQTAAGFRDVNGRLRTLDGRFATSAGSMQRSGSVITKALVDVKASLLSLAPAAVPVAASFAPMAAGAAGATTALAAFGAAVIPQIANLKDASDAQTKYADAVTKYGQHSKQAVQAQQQAAQVLAGMPKATQQAAAAYSVLKDQFKSFSDSTAKFTMAPVEKSFAVLGQIIPKLEPMVEGTSTQLSRLMNVAGGAVNTGDFDALSKKVADFANTSLKNATDRAIHFMRVMSEGDASGPISQFMDYARKQGPAVKELFTNLAAAAGNLAQGAAQAGPGLLSIVNALAKMAAAVPPELIGNLMQVYAAFKLIKLAGAGIAAVGGGIQGLAVKIGTLQTASAAAGGGIAGLKAAFLSLGTAAKATVVVAGITLLAVALTRLSQIGKQAPPDVDRLTTSLANLGRTGKVSGEAARAYGKDLSGLGESLRTLARPSNLDKTQQFLTSLIGMDSTPVKKAKEDFDGIDKALANMVRGGKADLAKQALEDTIASLKKQGFTSKEVMAQLGDYKSALADAALEAKLTAESMGLFGAQAQTTQAALDAQKASADGLRQSIQALNDVNRQGLGGMIGFESAIDAAAKAAKDNAGALSMNHGVLDLNSKKARDAASALQDLADKTDSAAASARESGSSWETVNGIYSRGRGKLIEYAEQMGLSKAQAKQLADQILKIPNKTSTIKMNKEDAQRGLEAFNAAVKKTPGAKSVTLKTLSKGAESILEAFGMKVKRLPNGKVVVTTKAGGALSTIASVSGAISNLDGKTATTYVKTVYTKTAAGRIHEPYARGGKVRGYADGGNIQAYPDGGFIQGPGSGTSDSILTLLGSGNVVRTSNTEFIVNARETARHRRLLELINSGQLPRFAKGGSVGGAARGAKDEIRAATSGSTETRLLSLMNAISGGHIKMATALKQVGTELSKTKDKINDLRSAASQLRDSVKSNILSGANITRAAGAEDSRVTINTILSQMTGSAANAKEFDTALKALKKRGLSSALLQQIAEAGIEGGGLETAQALLGGSAGQIKTLNSLQGQLTASATSAGVTTATAVYGPQIKAQEKLVKALDRLADALKKVGKKAGGGLADGLTVVGEEGPELLNLPTGSRVWSNAASRRMVAAPWASMLNSRSHSRTAPAAAGSAPAWAHQPLVIQLQVGDKQLGEVIIDPLRRAVHHRGGNVQAVLGKGGSS